MKPNPIMKEHTASSSLVNFENKIFQITKIKNRKKWTNEDDALLVHLAEKYKEKHWKEISKHFQNKNSLQCFSRYKRVRPGIVKGSWTKEEDDKILEMVREHGKAWSKIAKIINSRNGKQIRDRYINALDPQIKKGKFSDDEDRLLIKLYITHGPKWSFISRSFPNRTADMIKNRFHSSIKKIFFTQDVITRKTKLMQKLKEKRQSAMNDTTPITIANDNNCNSISNNICFSLEKNKKKPSVTHSYNECSSLPIDSSVISSINNASSSNEDLDFFSMMTENNNLFPNDEFFNLD